MSLILKGIDLPKYKEKYPIRVDILPNGDIFLDNGHGYELKVNSAIQIPKGHGRLIDGDKLRLKIAGHSDYHGDSILTAIICMMEGKKVDYIPCIDDD